MGNEGDKAFLPLFPGGPPLLVRVLTALAGVVDDLLLAGGDPERYGPLAARHGARHVLDSPPGVGPLGGLAAGLEAARYPVVLAVACDMPFLSAPLLAYQADLLVFHRRQLDAVVLRAPAPGGGPARLHPLHAAYARRSRAALATYLARGGRSLTGFLTLLRVRVVEGSEVLRFAGAELSPFNVNTPSDYHRATALAAAGPQAGAPRPRGAATAVRLPDGRGHGS